MKPGRHVLQNKPEKWNRDGIDNKGNQTKHYRQLTDYGENIMDNMMGKVFDLAVDNCQQRISAVNYRRYLAGRLLLWAGFRDQE